MERPNIISPEEARRQNGLPAANTYRTPFVEKYYQMDPETDDVVFDATELREGMIVLIESSHMRAEVSGQLTPMETERAMRYNRWAKISRLTVGDYETMTVFLATYEDGSKKKINVETDYAWIVKKNSMGVQHVIEEGGFFGSLDPIRVPKDDVLSRTSYSPLERHEIPVVRPGRPGSDREQETVQASRIRPYMPSDAPNFTPTSGKRGYEDHTAPGEVQQNPTWYEKTRQEWDRKQAENAANATDETKV